MTGNKNFSRKGDENHIIYTHPLTTYLVKTIKDELQLKLDNAGRSYAGEANWQRICSPHGKLVDSVIKAFFQQEPEKQQTLLENTSWTTRKERELRRGLKEALVQIIDDLTTAKRNHVCLVYSEIGSEQSVDERLVMLNHPEAPGLQEIPEGWVVVGGVPQKQLDANEALKDSLPQLILDWVRESGRICHTDIVEYLTENYFLPDIEYTTPRGKRGALSHMATTVLLKAAKIAPAEYKMGLDKCLTSEGAAVDVAETVVAAIVPTAGPDDVGDDEGGEAESDRELLELMFLLDVVNIYLTPDPANDSEDSRLYLHSRGGKVYLSDTERGKHGITEKIGANFWIVIETRLGRFLIKSTSGLNMWS